MFLETTDYPFVKSLEENWREILQEYEAVPSQRVIPWPEHSIYDFGWRAFPLVALGRLIVINASSCARTMALLNAIPGLLNAGFSILAAGSHVHPHVGYSSSVHRFHLGLKAPEGCGLRVGNDVRRWERGKVLAFDDTVEHSAWNESDEERVILLFDVIKDGATPEITPSALKAVSDIEEMMRQSLSGGHNDD